MTEAYGRVEVYGLTWELLHPRMTLGHLGYIPSFLTSSDGRSAIAQIRERYISGWPAFRGHRFTLHSDDSLTSPRDPRLDCRARTTLRQERILFYDHAWLLVQQPDKSFEIARID